MKSTHCGMHHCGGTSDSGNDSTVAVDRVDKGCHVRIWNQSWSPWGLFGYTPMHGWAKLGRRGAGELVEGIDIQSPHPLWKIGSVGRRRFRNGGALIPVEGMHGGRSLPSRREIVPRQLCGILIFVEDQLRIQNW
jgi:hypothetical protein